MVGARHPRHHILVEAQAGDDHHGAWRTRIRENFAKQIRQARLQGAERRELGRDWSSFLQSRLIHWASRIGASIACPSRLLCPRMRELRDTCCPLELFSSRHYTRHGAFAQRR